MKQCYAITIKKELTKTVFTFTESEQHAINEAHNLAANDDLENSPENEVEENIFISVEKK